MSSEDTGSPPERLRDEFLRLLETQQREQVYQAFMERHTQLVPHEFVQNHGIHFDLVLRKLAFGADYKSDFFYMSKSSDDWNLVFVEIEKPQSRYFRDNSNDLHRDFQKALEQIGRWRAWLSEPSNLASLLVQLAPMHVPLTMRRNPSFPKFVLVHGRRGEYHDSDVRRSIVRAQEQADFKILSFDSLVEGLSRKHECYIGVRHNEFIKILSDRIISPEIFGWVDPAEFKVSKALRAEIALGNPGGATIMVMDQGKPVNALPLFAQKVRV